MSFKKIPNGPLKDVALFCFPYAGAGASVFFPWGKGISGGVDVYAFEAAGKGDRYSEALPKEFNTLAIEAAAAILGKNYKSIILFGHSLGALLAYETAKTLKDNGCSPLSIIFSGRQAPSLASKMEPISHLPNQQFIEKIKLLGGTPQEIFEEPELLNIILPILKNDFFLAECYEDSNPYDLGVPVIVLSGQTDPWVNIDDLHHWSSVTSNSFEIEIFEGDHFFITKNELRLFKYLNHKFNKLIYGNASL